MFSEIACSSYPLEELTVKQIRIASAATAALAGVMLLSSCNKPLSEEEAAAQRIPADSGVEYVAGKWSSSLKTNFGLQLRCKNGETTTLSIGESEQHDAVRFGLTETREEVRRRRSVIKDKQDAIAINIDNGTDQPLKVWTILNTPNYLDEPGVFYSQAFHGIDVASHSSTWVEIQPHEHFNMGETEIAEVVVCAS